MSSRSVFHLLLVLINLGGAPASPSKSNRAADQEALQPFGGFIGDWRGVGQVERGKTRGAWKESSKWVWKLSSDSAALAVTFENGKYLKSGLLKPGKNPGEFRFEGVLADGKTRTFEGKTDEESAMKPLILKAVADDDKGPGLRRIRFTPLHETRLLLLLEAADGEDSSRFTRLGEVGYTREGVAFAAGDGSPVCIVTEGRGTTQVSYKGKTYWVCCSGCKDLFDDNPEAVLAEAEARKSRKEKEKANAKE